jgi:hypothetical protein
VNGQHWWRLCKIPGAAGDGQGLWSVPFPRHLSVLGQRRAVALVDFKADFYDRHS